jgi:hypothetical protein
VAGARDEGPAARLVTDAETHQVGLADLDGQIRILDAV